VLVVGVFVGEYFGRWSAVGVVNYFINDIFFVIKKLMKEDLLYRSIVA
jgi:hypothetical protein